MTLIQLEYVLAVAENKNFTLAAEKVFVTQPTLSMQIQKLEKELNIEIFDRSTHPIKITAIGQKIIEQAKVILRESRQMADLVNEIRENLEGEFIVGIIPTVLPTLVPLIYKNFKTKFPKANLTIREMKTDKMIEALAAQEIDFGIASTPVLRDDIIEIPVYYEPMIAFVPNNHRLSKKKKIEESDLDMEDLLLLEEGHCFRDNVLSICKNYKNSELKTSRLSVDSGSFYTLVKLAKDGFGMTILPALQAEDLQDENKRYFKEFQKPVPTREISIIYHSTQLKLRFVEELKTLIQNVIRGKIFIDSDQNFTPALKLTK